MTSDSNSRPSEQLLTESYTSILPSELNQHWEDYNRLRRDGRRDVSLETLQRFIEGLKALDTQTRTLFVNRFCTEQLSSPSTTSWLGDLRSSNSIQHPLFREIILPVLVEGYKANDATQIRWIGQLEQHVLTDRALMDRLMKEVGINDYYTSLFFLERSYSIESHPTTRMLIIQVLSRDIEYAYHHLPDSVLLDPEPLDQLLQKFEGYMNDRQNATGSDDDEVLEERYRTDLTEWREIADEWRDR